MAKCECTAEYKRLLIKTILYRILGLTITIVTVYIILGEIDIASGIGITDFVVKTINYYIYEAIWHKIRWGHDQNGDTRLRSVVKAVILRIEATLITLAVAYAFTKQIETSGWIAVIEMIQKIILYYCFERAWQYLKVWFGEDITIDGDTTIERRRQCCGWCQGTTDLPMQDIEMSMTSSYTSDSSVYSYALAMTDSSEFYFTDSDT